MCTEYDKYSVESIIDLVDNNVCILEPFKHLLKPLIANEWQTVTHNEDSISSNTITINKKNNEYDTINIEFMDSYYHFSLPIPNSKYNYYTKIKYSQPAFDFFEQFIEQITDLN